MADEEQKKVLKETGWSLLFGTYLLFTIFIAIPFIFLFGVMIYVGAGGGWFGILAVAVMAFLLMS